MAPEVAALRPSGYSEAILNPARRTGGRAVGDGFRAAHVL